LAWDKIIFSHRTNFLIILHGRLLISRQYDIELARIPATTAASCVLYQEHGEFAFVAWKSCSTESYTIANCNLLKALYFSDACIYKSKNSGLMLLFTKYKWIILKLYFKLNAKQIFVIFLVVKLKKKALTIKESRHKAFGWTLGHRLLLHYLLFGGSFALQRCLGRGCATFLHNSHIFRQLFRSCFFASLLSIS